MSFISSIIAHQLSAASVIRPRLPGKFESFISLENTLGEHLPSVADSQFGLRSTNVFPLQEKPDYPSKEENELFTGKPNPRLRQVTAHTPGTQDKESAAHYNDQEQSISASHLNKNTGLQPSAYMPASNAFKAQQDELKPNYLPANESANVAFTKDDQVAIHAAGGQTPTVNVHAQPLGIGDRVRDAKKEFSGLHTAAPLQGAYSASTEHLPQMGQEKPTIIKVSIGRIEVRAGGINPDAHGPVKRVVKSELKPKMSLEDYLKSRSAS